MASFAIGSRAGAAFLLVPFLWPRKEKTLAQLGETEGNLIIQPTA